MLIGFVHGLAGSGAMILLTMSTVKSVWEAVMYILLFGVGTVIGMLFFTTIIGIPFVLSRKRWTMNRALTLTMGVTSTVFGIYYMYNLGINEGLFRLWMLEHASEKATITKTQEQMRILFLCFHLSGLSKEYKSSSIFPRSIFNQFFCVFNAFIVNIRSYFIKYKL